MNQGLRPPPPVTQTIEELCTAGIRPEQRIVDRLRIRRGKVVERLPSPKNVVAHLGKESETFTDSKDTTFQSGGFRNLGRCFLVGGLMVLVFPNQREPR